MKIETLVKQYKNIGRIHSPIGLSRDAEVLSIIAWLWETHKIFVSVQYCHMNFPNSPESYMKFTGTYRLNCGQEHSDSFYCDKHFENPADAYFDAVKQIIRGLRFRLKP